jgi:DNA polymerase gamma 1
MPCVTPSQPDAIPPGESLGIADALRHTHGGSLFPDGRAMPEGEKADVAALLARTGYAPADCLRHRAGDAHFLRAQAAGEAAEVRMLARQAGRGGEGGKPASRRRRSDAAARTPSAGDRRVLSVVNVLEVPELVDLTERYLAWQASQQHRV